MPSAGLCSGTSPMAWQLQDSIFVRRLGRAKTLESGILRWTQVVPRERGDQHGRE